MIVVVVRILILYTLVVVALRLMGKREIGQLQPFELVVIIMISELASIPSGDMGIPLLSAIIPILVLLLASLLLAWITLKSEKSRAIICGTPSILIERGKIVEQELIKNSYNLTDLLEELRIKNIMNISDVEFAILETNGQMSVFPKSEKRAIIPEDLNITPPYDGLPLTIIMDGKLNNDNLKQGNKSLTWLKGELKKQSIEQIKDVLIASLDTSGELVVQAKQKKTR